MSSGLNVDITSIKIFNNPTNICNPFQFEVSFQCIKPLSDGLFAFTAQSLTESCSFNICLCSRSWMESYLHRITGQHYEWSRIRISHGWTCRIRPIHVCFTSKCPGSNQNSTSRPSWHYCYSDFLSLPKSRVHPRWLLSEKWIYRSRNASKSSWGMFLFLYLWKFHYIWIPSPRHLFLNK